MMRVVKEKYGIIFVDNNDIIVRVYETDDKEWRLLHYLNQHLNAEHASTDTVIFTEAIAELLSSPELQHIAEWRCFARTVPDQIVCDLTSATGMQFESLTPRREQEILCKGMFTEFW